MRKHKLLTFGFIKQLTWKQKLSFVLSIACIWSAIFLICFMQISPQSPIFFILVGLSGIFLFYVVISRFMVLTRQNLPDSYWDKRSLFGTPQDVFRLSCVYISDIPVRNIPLKFEVYRDKIVVSGFRRCLIVRSASQVEIEKFLCWHLVECCVDNSSICCYIRKRQMDILQRWMQQNDGKSN